MKYITNILSKYINLKGAIKWKYINRNTFKKVKPENALRNIYYQIII